MAPSSKTEKDGNKQTQRKHKEHVVKLLNRGKLSGQYSQRLFRKLPPRVCVPLKNIVSEEFLRAGHIFLGFTKCGRYVLSYTSDCGEDDDFSFYTYHLYWWEFNLHSRLKQVHHVRLFTGEDIYSDLYLTVCEWPNDHSKIVIFGFNTRSSSSVLMNLMMSDENNRDIYITIASMPPPRPCSQCCPTNTSTIRTGSGECLEHGYMLNSRYQVVYPFPTFQPAFQLKKDQVIFLNTSYSLVACSVSLCPGYEDDKVQLPFTVTDLKGRNLQLVTGPHNGQSVCVEQLTLDFEYLINEVIRSDARWAPQFCSFNDYDVVILEVCPETNTVVINIGLLLLAFSNPEEEHCRPNTYHSSLQVSWDLNTGVCHTVGVGDLTEVKGQTSGSVWSSYRKSCVNTVMKWLVPESSSRYINRMTNEALHKGSTLQVLADSDRSTWIIL
ncbi:DDB1- and CUL4-associated factor 15-like isoform X3 [Salvelinus fontinalis]|uniref:DDB1- and CUL4-associated factor 15-like isoform X3 n=1 Tax=Salvelinus fontinalis TaxID=8038 RepID=UPI00248691A6|nr:DDB1- and CUL4-associated factor 15-like isoform X3 [Salvelinus fontinalis]